MTTKTFEMTWEQVDALIVEELQDAYETCLNVDKDEGGFYLDPDWKLLEAIERVLEYYLSKTEFDKWMQKAALRKLTLISELMGGYKVD